MSKKKTELEIAGEQVQTLVDQTNKKIKTLGEHVNTINTVLSDIQDLFDKIRNVPEENAREYQKIKEIRLEWVKHVEKIEAEYKTCQIWLGGGLTIAEGVMAGISALLPFAGPIGWALSLGFLIGGGNRFLITHKQKSRIERIFLDVCSRDKRNFELTIVEINKRIARIKDEKKKLNAAIAKIETFGLDYSAMTEEQQYTLGTYVNLMFSSTQLLINPIMGLQPKYTDVDFNGFVEDDAAMEKYASNRELFIYFANLLYGIKTDEVDRKLLAKSYRHDKKFCSDMGIEKSVITSEFMNAVYDAIELVYIK